MIDTIASNFILFASCVLIIASAVCLSVASLPLDTSVSAFVSVAVTADEADATFIVFAAPMGVLSGTLVCCRCAPPWNWSCDGVPNENFPKLFISIAANTGCFVVCSAVIKRLYFLFSGVLVCGCFAVLLRPLCLARTRC